MAIKSWATLWYLDIIFKICQINGQQTHAWFKKNCNVINYENSNKIDDIGCFWWWFKLFFHLGRHLGSFGSIWVNRRSPLSTFLVDMFVNIFLRRWCCFCSISSPNVCDMFQFSLPQLHMSGKIDYTQKRGIFSFKIKVKERCVCKGEGGCASI